MSDVNDESRPVGPPGGPGGEGPHPEGYLPPHRRPGELPPAVPEPQPPGDQSWRAARSFLLSILVILLLGGAALFIMARWESGTPGRQDLLETSAHLARDVEVEFETQSGEQAARFVRDRFGRRVSTPAIQDALLVGVGSAEVLSDVRVPAYIFREADGGSIVVLAYNYAILDRFESELQLERSIFHQIEDPEHREVRDLGKERVVVWRYRGDIFFAVTGDASENVRRRIFSF